MGTKKCSKNCYDKKINVGSTKKCGNYKISIYSVSDSTISLNWENTWTNTTGSVISEVGRTVKVPSPEHLTLTFDKATSTSVTLDIKDETPTDKPTGLSIDNSVPEELTITWSANQESGVEYTLQRSTNLENWIDVATNLTSTSYTDTGLTPGTTYYYQVIANCSVDSVPSDLVFAVVKSKCPPSLNAPVISGSAGNAQVTIEWADVPSAVAYTLHQKKISDGSETKYDFVTSPKTITGLTNDEAYEFYLKAFCNGLTSPKSNVITLTPSAVYVEEKCKTVTGLKAVAKEDKVELTWGTSRKNIDCEIWRDGFLLATVKTSGYQGKYTDKDLTPNRKYVYSVRVFCAKEKVYSLWEVVIAKTEVKYFFGKLFSLPTVYYPTTEIEKINEALSFAGVQSEEGWTETDVKTWRDSFGPITDFLSPFNSLSKILGLGPIQEPRPGESSSPTLSDYLNLGLIFLSFTPAGIKGGVNSLKTLGRELLDRLPLKNLLPGLGSALSKLDPKKTDQLEEIVKLSTIIQQERVTQPLTGFLTSPSRHISVVTDIPESALTSQNALNIAKIGKAGRSRYLDFSFFQKLKPNEKLLLAILAWNLLTDWVWVTGWGQEVISALTGNELARWKVLQRDISKNLAIAYGYERQGKREDVIDMLRTIEVQLVEAEILIESKDIVTKVGKKFPEFYQELEAWKVQFRSIAKSVGYFQQEPVSDVLHGVPTHVFDGDTFNFKDKEGNEYRVRILGIDAPEVGTQRGIAAYNYLNLKIFPSKVGQDITCFIDMHNPFDICGRLLAVVCMGHLTDFSVCERSDNIALEMLEKGLVDLYLPSRHKYIDKKEYRDAYKFMKKDTILKVKSIPTDAEIFIDGSSQNLYTIETIRGLTEGSHSVTVKKTGYVTPTAKSITLKKGVPIEVFFELSPTTAKLKVYSKPTHAKIQYKLKGAASYTDPVRVTPDVLILDPGTYIIKVTELDTSQSANMEITLSAGDDKEIYIPIIVSL